MATEQQRTQVLELYTAYFNRTADKAGVDYWLNEMVNNDWTIDMVALTFSQQTEYTNLYNGLSDEDVVARVYTNVLNRTADEAGASYWAGELSNGNVSVSQLVQAVITAATEMDNSGAYKNLEDANLFNNKIEVSQYAYNNNVNETDISLESITGAESSVSDIQKNIDDNYISNNTNTQQPSETLSSNEEFMNYLYETYPGAYEKSDHMMEVWVAQLDDGSMTKEDAELNFYTTEQINQGNTNITIPTVPAEEDIPSPELITGVETNSEAYEFLG